MLTALLAYGSLPTADFLTSPVGGYLSEIKAELETLPIRIIIVEDHTRFADSQEEIEKMGNGMVGGIAGFSGGLAHVQGFRPRTEHVSFG